VSGSGFSIRARHLQWIQECLDLKGDRSLHPNAQFFIMKGKASMSTTNLSAESAGVTKEQLINDFKVVVSDAEALLKATAGQGGETMAAMRSKVEASLAAAKAKMTEAEAALVARAKVAAKATDEYVHVHPWQAIGIAASIGVVVGLLIGRR
jgi:ElaB/YqjD/DUF883 family membrane-anchored ribosome-binding protein